MTEDLKKLEQGYVVINLNSQSTSLKDGLREIYKNALGIKPKIPDSAHLYVTNAYMKICDEDKHMTIKQFTEMLLTLFNISFIKHSDVINITNDNGIIEFPFSDEFKKTIWDLTISDVNFVIFKEKHCN